MGSHSFFTQSPTALKVTLRLLQLGGDMDLAQALQTEYRLTQRCVADRDFHEGIRAGEYLPQLYSLTSIWPKPIQHHIVVPSGALSSARDLIFGTGSLEGHAGGSIGTQAGTLTLTDRISMLLVLESC